jgi:hypothetical protein
MVEAFSLPRHPLDVKPTGNAYTSRKSLDNPFQYLPDELLIQILEQLKPKELLNIGLTCKTLFAFSRVDDFWKTFCIE